MNAHLCSGNSFSFADVANEGRGVLQSGGNDKWKIHTPVGRQEDPWILIAAREGRRGDGAGLIITLAGVGASSDLNR